MCPSVRVHEKRSSGLSTLWGDATADLDFDETFMMGSTPDLLGSGIHISLMAPVPGQILPPPLTEPTVYPALQRSPVVARRSLAGSVTADDNAVVVATDDLQLLGLENLSAQFQDQNLSEELQDSDESEDTKKRGRIPSPRRNASKLTRKGTSHTIATSPAGGASGPPAATAGPEADISPHPTDRKGKKNQREKERRLQVNQKFDELAELVCVDKVDKVSVLAAAIDIIRRCVAPPPVVDLGAYPVVGLGVPGLGAAAPPYPPHAPVSPLPVHPAGAVAAVAAAAVPAGFGLVGGLPQASGRPRAVGRGGPLPPPLGAHGDGSGSGSMGSVGYRP